MLSKGSQEGIIFKNAPLVIEREDVQQEVDKLRIEWEIPTGGFKSYKKYHDWVTNLTNQLSFKDLNTSRYSLFLDSVNKTCKLFKLPNYWIPFLVKYISRGQIEDTYRPRSGITYNTPTINIISNKDKVRLEFSANAKLKDIKSIWPDVQILQKTLPDYERTRKRRKLKLELYISKQLKKSKTPKDIYGKLPFSFGYPNESTISKTIQRTKKLIKRQ
jgi:hypothetical protein